MLTSAATGRYIRPRYGIPHVHGTVRCARCHCGQVFFRCKAVHFGGLRGGFRVKVHEALRHTQALIEEQGGRILQHPAVVSTAMELAFSGSPRSKRVADERYKDTPTEPRTWIVFSRCLLVCLGFRLSSFRSLPVYRRISLPICWSRWSA